MMKKGLLLIVWLFALVSGTHSQLITTNNVTVPFNSGLQNMFDPESDPTPYTINEYFAIPDTGPFSWDYRLELGDSWSTGGFDLGPFGYFDGFGFSMEFVVGTWGKVGFEFEVGDFTEGLVDVNYPINVSTKYNQDNDYSIGEWVQLKTDYNVLAGWEIETFYPDSGFVDVNLFTDVNAELSATVGVSAFGYSQNFAYAPVNIHTGGYGLGSNAFHITADTSYYIGYANTSSIYPSAPGYPFGTGAPDAHVSCTNAAHFLGLCDPGQVYQTDPSVPIEMPSIIGNPVPFSFSASLPGCETTTSLIGAKDLRATGDSTYFELTFPLLAYALEACCGIPGDLLAGEIVEDIGLDSDLEIKWNLASLDMTLQITHKQQFDFKPKVRGRYTFPTPVDYKIYRNNLLVSTSTGTVINYVVGDSVIYKFPCYYQDLTITRSFSIDTLASNFWSKTWDNFEVNFKMMLDGLIVRIPGFNILDSYSWEICIPYGYPCGSVFWPSWCSGEVCESFSTPSIDFPTIEISTCQLWQSLGIPAGSSFGTYDTETCALVYFDETPISVPVRTWHENNWPMIFWESPGDIQYDATPIVMRAKQLTASSTVTNILCNGASTGSITVAMQNGKAPYTVNWNNGVPSGSIATDGGSLTVSNLPAGNYVATIYDANGCQILTGGTISEPAFPVRATGIVNSISCFGLNDGSITISPQGGVGSYSYSWDNDGTGDGFTDPQNLSSLLAGTYTVIVRDANACVSPATSFTITQPTVLSQVSNSVTNVSCNAGSNGSISVVMTGGTLPYTYSWSPAPASGNQPIVSNLTAGNYNLTVTDGKGCSQPYSYLVTQPTALALSSVVTNVTCNGFTNGAIDLTVSGGTPSAGVYNYAWYNAANQLLSWTTQDINSLAAGLYTVKVTDQKGCTASLGSTVTQPSIVTVSNPILQNINCFGNATGSININPSGGVPGYTFDWSNDGTGDFNDSEDLLNVPAGSYTVVVRDNNLCTYPFSYSLTQPSAALALSSSITHVKCFGDATGAIDVNTTGGTGPYVYSWNNGASTEDLTGLSAGTFILTVTDAKGCTASLNLVVNQPLQPLTLSETHVNVLCHGGNNGSIDLTTTGGTSPYTYEWSNGASITLTAVSQDLTQLNADSYTVLVTDINNCDATVTIAIAEPPAPLAITGVYTDILCFGAATGAADISVTGGTAPYSFDWSTDGIGDNNDAEDLVGAPAGNYTFVVTDNNGCTESLAFTLNQPISPLTASVVPTASTCFGSATGSMDLTVYGGTAPYNYVWSNGATTEDIDLLPSAVYTVTITDTNGCTLSAGGFVSQPNQTLGVTLLVTEPSCYGYLDGSINLTITGGTTPYYVEWGDQNQFLLNNPSELLSGIGEGIYLFRITDKNGCSVEQTIDVGQPDTLAVDQLINDVACYGDSTGSVILTPNGGTAPYSYAWSNGTSAQNPTGLPTGWYIYVLTDANGCKFEQTLFIDQSPIIDVGYEIDPLSCVDQFDAAIYVVTGGGNQPYTWSWSNGAVGSTNDSLTAGVYILTVTDNFGCQRTFDFSIEQSYDECVYIVNTITPNGDDYNDTWIIENLDLYPNAEVRVFNRWGNLLFESIGEYAPWDGTVNGEPLPSEVYYYIIVLNNGVGNEYTGTITIVR